MRSRRKAERTIFRCLGGPCNQRTWFVPLHHLFFTYNDLCRGSRNGSSWLPMKTSQWALKPHRPSRGSWATNRASHKMQILPKAACSSFPLEPPLPQTRTAMYYLPISPDPSLRQDTPEQVAGPSSSPTMSDEKSGVASPRPQPTRHEEFWLYDGSIVLAVENSLFRVHQTILANHSEVFADLFTVPQPDGEFMIDGCHVVHLYDDERDFVDLLMAVYHPECVSHFYCDLQTTSP